ncbi:normal mucosa of esophagus-specific gene 1 protein isoform X2 [Octopus bimaculoides]|nr:normal mucosa of esophagus-specific gene 1 protein isoform X2 [Octopus bimaculoides]
MKSFGFGLRTFKRFPELLPLVGFITFAVTMGSSFAVYSLLTKPDVRLFGRDTEMPYDLVKPTESRKLVNINEKYVPIPELEQLKKEIGSFKN